MKSFFKGFFMTLLIILLLVGGGYYYLTSKGHDADAKETLETVTGEGENHQILVLGVDSADAGKAENTRSDVMMIANVNRDKNQVSLISIPRDTRTSIPGRNGKTKINHAYAYGGADLALDTVNGLLGLDIPYYVVVDYDFVKEVVDKTGGVQVDVPMDMHYEDPSADPPLYIDLKAGPQVLDGDQALQFLRFRKGYANADLGRVEAQQAFLKGLFQAATSKNALINSPRLIKPYLTKTQNNLSVGKALGIGLDGLKVGSENFITGTLPGSPQTIEGLSYYILDEGASQDMLVDYGFKPGQ
ncbi:MAG: LCP family protein [Tissierellia bacterium]|nr:LCP family protein [Tissierellia bacterium]